MNTQNIYHKEIDSILSLEYDSNIDYKKEYHAKTIKSGNQLEVAIYELWPTNSQNKGSAKNITRKEQEHLNIKYAKQMCIRKMNANFSDKDSWITLTYTDDNLPKSLEDANNKIKNYIKCLKRKFKDIKVKYIYSTEYGEGRVHHHLVINIADRDTLEDYWASASEKARKRKNKNYVIKKYGRTHARRLQPDDFGLTGMAVYITKESQRNVKKYCCSKNLDLPEIKKTKTLNGKRLTRSFIKKLAEDKALAKLEFLKMFPNYQFNSVEVKQTPYTKGYYIYAHLNEVVLQ